jgi:hypothetical protein
MRIGFHFAHPAHFHFFKNVIKELRSNGHNILITYNDKDVLENLINESDFNHLSQKLNVIKNPNSSLRLHLQFIQKNIGVFIKYLKFKPDIVVGTSIIICIIGKILKYYSVIFNEDDFDVVRKTADFGYPMANNIVCPSVCRTGRFEPKCVKYNGYHELAYLNPKCFQPKKEIVNKYFSFEKPYFIIRFAKLIAHHDKKIRGINVEIAHNIIDILRPHGNVYITSERELSQSLEKYRLNINPIDMHHILYYTNLFIGDSQTMAAEAGVLGTPFIRYNDFVGKISYLDELENTYKLGYGFKTTEIDKLYEKLKQLVTVSDLERIFHKRREKMLSDKINVDSYISWFIENYPESVNIVKENPDYQYNFKFIDE